MRSISMASAPVLARLLAVCAASCLVVFQPRAASQESEHLANLEQRCPFNISAGPLELALLQFSRQTRIQVIVSPNIPQVSVAGVRGSLTAREALMVLLRTTGLTYAVVGDTITIHTVESGNASDSLSTSKGSPSDRAK
jgi:hypothetical protein